MICRFEKPGDLPLSELCKPKKITGFRPWGDRGRPIIGKSWVYRSMATCREWWPENPIWILLGFVAFSYRLYEFLAWFTDCLGWFIHDMDFQHFPIIQIHNPYIYIHWTLISWVFFTFSQHNPTCPSRCWLTGSPRVPNLRPGAMRRAPSRTGGCRTDAPADQGGRCFHRRLSVIFGRPWHVVPGRSAEKLIDLKQHI
jgi:hypothetical protein